MLKLNSTKVQGFDTSIAEEVMHTYPMPKYVSNLLYHGTKYDYIPQIIHNGLKVEKAYDPNEGCIWATTVPYPHTYGGNLIAFYNSSALNKIKVNSDTYNIFTDIPPSQIAWIDCCIVLSPGGGYYTFLDAQDQLERFGVDRFIDVYKNKLNCFVDVDALVDYLRS